MLLYADVETSFLAARVLLHGVFRLPEYRHLLSNATIVSCYLVRMADNVHTLKCHKLSPIAAYQTFPIHIYYKA